MGGLELLNYLYLKSFKKALTKKKFSQEEIKAIITLVDDEIETYYIDKKNVLEKEIENLKDQIKHMKIEYNSMEIENESIKKRLETLVETNKMLLHQLEQRDNTTHKTLAAIKENLIMGQEVIETISITGNKMLLENNNKK